MPVVEYGDIATRRSLTDTAMQKSGKTGKSAEAARRTSEAATRVSAHGYFRSLASRAAATIAVACSPKTRLREGGGIKDVRSYSSGRWSGVDQSYDPRPAAAEQQLKGRRNEGTGTVAA